MFVNNMDQRDMFMYQEPALNCKVSLQNKDLWQQFHELETEMIITKSGRRMFPALRIKVEDLDPSAQYCVLVEMVSTSKCRYRYTSSGGWAPAGAEEAQSPNRVYLHPESPAPGHHWMSQNVTFGRLKLTNTVNPPPGQLVLSSMHRYQPRIIIVKTSDPRNIAWAPHALFTFPETQFIAVTAYQNDKITKLKIDNNPFAKGFRENGQSKCKRKRQQEEEKEEEIIVDDEEEIKHVVKREALAPSPNLSDSSSERTTSSPEGGLIQTPPIMYPTYPSAYYYPPAMDYYNHYFAPPHYMYGYLTIQKSPCEQQPIPQDLSAQRNETPRKLTDFSIRAITGIA